MKQLTVKKLYKRLKEIQRELCLTDEDFEKLPIYLGDDDELNGVHCAWYCEDIDADNADDEDVVDMINENICNEPLHGKGILIS